MPLAAAAVARVMFDARCQAFLARYLGDAAVWIGRRTGQGARLAVHLSSLAGDVVVALDPTRCTAWALLDRMARRPQQQALACALASEMLERISRASGFEDVGLEVRALTSQEVNGAAAATVATVRIGPHELDLLEMDPAFCLFASEDMRERPLQVPGELRSLRLGGVAVLGERTMAADLWSSVERGDVFLLGRSPLKLAWRIGGGAGWRAEARLVSTASTTDTDHASLPGYELTLETAPRSATEETRMDTDAAGLPVIELPVQFELQTASLALTEIAALAPGHVMALDVPVEHAVVRLMCQGRQVGSGQLVVVGDHLGVRVERMAWARDAAADR